MSKSIDLTKSLGNPQVALSTTSDDSEIEKEKKEAYEELGRIGKLIDTKKNMLKKIIEDCEKASNKKEAVFEELNMLETSSHELIESNRNYQNKITTLSSKLNDLEKTEKNKLSSLKSLDSSIQNQEKITLNKLSEFKQIEENYRKLLTKKTNLDSEIIKLNQKISKEKDLDKKIEEKQKLYVELNKESISLKKDVDATKLELANMIVDKKQFEIERSKFENEKEGENIVSKKFKLRIENIDKEKAELDEKIESFNKKVKEMQLYNEEINNNAEKNNIRVTEAEFKVYQKNTENQNLKVYIDSYKNFFIKEFTVPVNIQEIKDVIAEFNAPIVGDVVEPVE